MFSSGTPSSQRRPCLASSSWQTPGEAGPSSSLELWTCCSSLRDSGPPTYEPKDGRKGREGGCASPWSVCHSLHVQQNLCRWYKYYLDFHYSSSSLDPEIFDFAGTSYVIFKMLVSVTNFPLKFQ